MKFYSASTGGFYSTEIHGDSMPHDALHISDEHYAALMQAQSAGNQIKPDENGAPIAVRPEGAPYSVVFPSVMNAIRAMREQILNRIVGIGVDAMISGDMDTAHAVVAARQSLLDLPHHPDIMEASNADYLRTAVLVAYHAIIEAAPESLKKAFGEFVL